jgi:hypothetical protein
MALCALAQVVTGQLLTCADAAVGVVHVATSWLSLGNSSCSLPVVLWWYVPGLVRSSCWLAAAACSCCAVAVCAGVLLLVSVYAGHSVAAC